MDVSKHHNAEDIIRFYFRALPPRGVESILDIGSGRFAPYRGILSARCKRYNTLDIRSGPKVHLTLDLSESLDFASVLMINGGKKWTWGWCTEVFEHIPRDFQERFFENVLGLVDNVVFTFPTPIHPSFDLDPGHVTVEIDFQELSKSKGKNMFDFSAKTGRRVLVFSDHKQVKASPKGLVFED